MSLRLNIALLLTINFLIVPSISRAQNFNPELHIGLGNSVFLGDLGGKPGLGTNDFTDVDYQTISFSFSAGFKHAFGKRAGLRFIGSYARISGNDKFTENPERRQRNLSFFSPVIDAYVAAEFIPGESRKFYLFMGLGVVYFEPKTQLDGRTYKLRLYGTEGQYFVQGKEPYKPFAMMIPFGVGFHFAENFLQRHSLSLELVFHLSTTDYMDDVSTTYVDKAELANSNGQIAVQLMDRSQSNIPGFSDPGSIRGDRRDKDNYSYCQIVYKYSLRRMYSGKGHLGRGRLLKRMRSFCPDEF